MDEKVKKKWLRALRSGKYKQGQLALRVGSRYCCLGVLCDISGAKWRNFGFIPGYSAGELQGQTEDEALSGEFRRSVGLTKRQVSHLMDMNDGRGKSFEEIADYI